jgi:hypothetical protein
MIFTADWESDGQYHLSPRRAWESFSFPFFHFMIFVIVIRELGFSNQLTKKNISSYFDKKKKNKTEIKKDYNEEGTLNFISNTIFFCPLQWMN